jgi:hypothetical protein
LKGGFVADSECCRDKLSQYKIGGQSKPFIDKNLQLQLPGWDFHHNQTHPSFNPIYSHYIGSLSVSFLSPQINEAELYHAMIEAECSYEAWRQMQQQLKEVAKGYKS